MIFRSTLLLQHEGEKGEDAALAMVVRSNDQDQILDADDENQRPGNQREQPVDVLLGRGVCVMTSEALTKRVQRTRADVAVDDAERRQGQDRQTPAGRPRLDVLSLRRELRKLRG